MADHEGCEQTITSCTPVFTQCQHLKTNVDTVKQNICKVLNVDIDNFATVTAKMIKDCPNLKKKVIAEGLLSILSVSEGVCAELFSSKPTANYSQADFMSSISQQFTSQLSAMKSELMLSMNETIENSIENTKSSEVVQSAMLESI